MNKRARFNILLLALGLATVCVVFRARVYTYLNGTQLSHHPSTLQPDTPSDVSTVKFNSQNPATKIHEGVFGEFEAWAAQYARAASSTEKSALEQQGVALATQRRAELKQIVVSDPKHALELAVSPQLRSAMPKSVAEQLEEQIDTRAAFTEVIACNGKCADPACAHSKKLYQVSFGTHVLNANIYGDVKVPRSVSPIPVKGISVDREMAVDEKSGLSVASREGYTGGSLGITNPSELPGGFLFGKKTYLLIRINFSDDTTEPINEFTAYETLRQVDQYYNEDSYGKFSILPTVTPMIVMPKTKQWYKLNDNTNSPQGSPPFWGNCKADAMAAAAAAGYDPANYDFVGLRFNYVGDSLSGRPMLLSNNSATTWAHELGHDLGYPHANSYISPTPDSPGSAVEYGNPFDDMGSGAEAGGIGTTIGHNNITFKNLITQWLPDSYISNIPSVSKGTYRIYAMDFGVIDPANKYGVRILKDDYRDMWIEFRQNQFQKDPFLPNGVTVNYSPGFWGNYGGQTAGAGLLQPSNNWGGYLPSQLGNYPPNNVLNVASRAAVGSDVLLIGETLIDSKAGIYVTPVAKNATTPPSMDLVINVGDFSSQPVPTIQPMAVAPAPNAKGNYRTTTAITFTATANDSAGNPLAYFWDFNDGTYSTNNLNTQTHTYSKVGTYRARCIVSDMMGHRASVGKTVFITDATDVAPDFTVTGTCSVLADGNAGVEGVQVNGCGETVYSDSDGGFLMHNISGGTPIGVKEGYRADLPPHPTTPTVLDPYWNTFQAATPVASKSSVNNENLTSCHLATVGFSPPTAAVAEGQTLTVTVTRAFDVGSNNTVAEQNAYNYWLNTNTPCTAWIPEVTGDGANGGPYGVHDVQDVLSMITITPLTSNGPKSFTSSSVHVVGTTTAHLQWDFTMPEGCTQVTAKITFKTIASKKPPRVLQFILQDAKGRSDGTLGGYTATDPTNGQMIVTVTDPTAPPTATLVANQAAAVEGGVNGQFTVKLDQPAPATMPVRFKVATQTGGQSGSTTNTWGNPTSAANFSVDYKLFDINNNPITLDGSLTGSVTVLAGQKTAVITVAPLDNGLLTPNRVVDLTLLPDTATTARYITGTPGEAVVTIADKNPLPILTIIATGPVCTEGSDGKFTVTRTANDLSQTMTVPYSIGGSALNGVEYKRLFGSVVIPPGAASADIVIHSLGDTLLSNGIDALQLPGKPIAHVCTLALKSDTAWSIDFNHYKDNVVINEAGGKPFVSVQTGNSSGTSGGLVDESAGAKAGWFKFSRLNTNGDLVISYSITRSTAVIGTDYDVDAPANPPKNQSKTFNGTITIPDGFTEAYVNLDIFFATGGGIANTKSVIVDIIPSGAYDIDPSGSSATMLITDATQITSGPYNGTTVNTVTLTSTNRQASELPTSFGNFWVERSGSGGAANQPLTVNFTLQSGPGYGVQGVDFKLVEHNSGTTLTSFVTIPTGVQFASIDVVPIDNHVSIGTQKVTMTLTSLTDALNNPYSVGIPNTDTVTISEGDGPGNLPKVQFDNASAQSITRPTNYQIAVSLSAPVPAGQIATVDYKISGGSALILTDYDLVPNKEIFGGTLTFSAGQQHQFINLDILNTKRLADLTIMISLSNAYNAVLGTPASFTYTINDPTPAITSSLTASGVIGTPFSYQITTTNGPILGGGFTATGLPSWAHFDANTGTISGTPDATGTFNINITATNSYATGAATLVLTINNPSPPVITSSHTATGFIGFPYTPFYQITASNFPSSFNATGLPAGLSVNTTTGAISGTPTAASGNYNVTISASNLGGTGSVTLVITLNKPPVPVISSKTTDNTSAGFPYSYQITASNFPTSFSATNLPTGLSVNTSTGVISGAVNAAGTYTITLGATNAGGNGTATLTLTVVIPSPPVITSATTVSGIYNAAFSYQIAGTNFPLGFTATGLPAWATLNTTTGVISGTPNAVGSSTVDLTATNLGGTGSAKLTITINDVLPPVITSSGTAGGTSGAAFSYQITATNNPTSYSAVNLPAGLTLDTATGLISGTPALPLNTSVTISGINHGGTGSATLVIQVAINAGSGPVLVSGLSANPNPAAAGEDIVFQAFVADPNPGSVLITWDLGDGTVRFGDSFVHKYLTDGTYVVTAKVTDGAGKTTSGTVTVVVGTPPPGGGGPASAALALTVSKMQGAAKFTASGKDSAGISGVLQNVPTPFNPLAQTITLNIGGAAATFTLDKHGKAKSGTASFAFMLKALKRSKTNLNPGFSGGNLKFTAKFSHGSWASLWNFTPTTASGGTTMTATLVFGGNTYSTDVSLTYKGNDKGGSFKH